MIKESLSMSHGVSQSDRISLQSFQTFSEQFDAQSESPIKHQKLGPMTQSVHVKSNFDKVETRRLAKTDRCTIHGEEVILLCLKDSEKVCARCLNSTHLLHPVVPLNSLDQLDF